MKQTRSPRIRSAGQGRTIWPSLLLGFLLTLFLVAFAFAGYQFLLWGRSVAAQVPDMPALALPKLVRAVPVRMSTTCR